MTVGDLARTMPKINEALENRKAYYHTSTVEVEGKINKIPISILINPRASLIYIYPNLVEKFASSWLVQLATGAKRKLISFVKNF